MSGMVSWSESRLKASPGLNWAGKRAMLSIIIPAFNEEASLALLHDELVETITREALEYEIIFVDEQVVPPPVDSLRARWQRGFVQAGQLAQAAVERVVLLAFHIGLLCENA